MEGEGVVGLAVVGKMAEEGIEVKGGTRGREHKGNVLASTAEAFTGEVKKVVGWGVDARVHMIGEGNKGEVVRIRVVAKLGQVLAHPGRAAGKSGLGWWTVGVGVVKKVVHKKEREWKNAGGGAL